MNVPRRTYNLEGRLADGPWLTDEQLQLVSRREAEAVMQWYQDANPGMRFRLVVVKAQSKLRSRE
jgi:hypothetical protein